MTGKDPWSTILGLEFEAVWTYPVIAARISEETQRATDSFQAHRTVRDELLARFTAKGWTVPTTPLAYDVGNINTVGQARNVAADLEQRICAASADLVGSTSDDDRRWAIAELRRAAAASVSWGSEPTATPGLRPARSGM